MHSLKALLGTELPIIQAPMAGSQGSALAVAVCNAGGLGSLPAAMLDAAMSRKELGVIAAQTDRPYNVNFFCHVPPVPDPSREAGWRQALSGFYGEFGIDAANLPAGAGRYPFSGEMAEVLAEFRPRVVSFHFGLPAQDLLARVKAWGATVISSATTVDEALWLEQHGADVIVAQGLEAGGHRGIFLSRDLNTQLGLFALVPQIVRAVRVPVIAAGGITDAAGVRGAMALGAAGVQVGTAYLLSNEATTGPVHRAALAELAAGRGAPTALTNLFTGRPARGIVNRLMREMGPLSDVPPEFPLATAAIAPLRSAAERQGSGDFSPLWSGQNASGCKALPAAEITRALAEGLER